MFLFTNINNYKDLRGLLTHLGAHGSLLADVHKLSTKFLQIILPLDGQVVSPQIFLPHENLILLILLTLSGHLLANQHLM